MPSGHPSSEDQVGRTESAPPTAEKHSTPQSDPSAPRPLVKINHNGSNVSNFPVQLNEKISKGGAIYDINNNGLDPASSDSPEKAIISLQNDRGTEYMTYIRVQNELAAAYNELRNDASLNKFGETIKEINDRIELKRVSKKAFSECLDDLDEN